MIQCNNAFDQTWLQFGNTSIHKFSRFALITVFNNYAQ